MRIFLASIVIILGANLLIDLMDSNLVDVMQERRETIEKQMERMWRSAKCPLFWHSTPFPCILEKWRGDDPTTTLVLSLLFHA